MAGLLRNRLGLAAVLVLIVMLAKNAAAHRCINELGHEVDWFVSLRVPNSRRYLVYEPGLSGFRNTTEVLLDKAVSGLSLSSGHVMLWNDQTVFKTASSSKAHAKGILNFDENWGGFLLIHSIPHFVDTSEGHFDHTTRETSMYGQSLVCVSLNSMAEANTVIDHVISQNSNVYNNTFLNTVRPRAKTERMISQMPHGFSLVTKTSMGEEHPFEDLLSDHFKTNWMVNTWGRPYKPSSCGTKFKVSNIIMKNLDSYVMKFTQDHSKWAISYGDHRRLVCIGDLNHMDSQAKRGGSYLCIDNEGLYRTFFNTILEDECKAAKQFKP